MAERDSISLAEQLGRLSAPGDRAERDRLILAGLEAAGALEREVAIAWAARTFEPTRLTALMADEANAAIRNAAIEALRRQGPYALEHLHARLQESDPDLVMFSVQTLALIASPASIPALLPLLQHSATNVVQVTAEALGALKSEAAVPGLIALLGGDLWLQLAAIEALGTIGDPRAVGPLLAHYPLARDLAGLIDGTGRFAHLPPRAAVGCPATRPVAGTGRIGRVSRLRPGWRPRARGRRPRHVENER
jgi:hypothetical protein